MDTFRVSEEFRRFIGETRLANVPDAHGRRWLRIPGHAKHVIPAHKNTRATLEIRLKPRPNTNFYEETTTLLLSFLFSRFTPHTFIDVGAGHFSLVAATQLAAQPIVHAIDMSPRAIDRLARTANEAGLADRIAICLAGLSDVHIGKKRIWFARTKMFEYEPQAYEYREPWWIRLKFALQLSDSSRRQLQSAEVLLTTLDRYCQDHSLAPGLIKIDVDGYEGKVLRGAQCVLAEHQPIVLLELHTQKLLRDGFSRSDVAQILFDAGYLALFITDHHKPSRCQLVPVEPGHQLIERQDTDMILFVPERLQDHV